MTEALTDTLATVVSGPFKGRVLYVVGPNGDGRFLCHFENDEDGQPIAVALLPRDALRPWRSVSAVSPDGTTVS